MFPGTVWTSTLAGFHLLLDRDDGARSPINVLVGKYFHEAVATKRSFACSRNSMRRSTRSWPDRARRPRALNFRRRLRWLQTLQGWQVTARSPKGQPGETLAMRMPFGLTSLDGTDFHPSTLHIGAAIEAKSDRLLALVTASIAGAWPRVKRGLPAPGAALTADYWIYAP